MGKKIQLGTLFVSLCVFSFVSCSDDDAKDPSDTITLNMMNEENGKTHLGISDVFINKSYNFKTTSCYIMDAGNVSGLGVKAEPKVDNLAQEVAVSSGHLYQIFDRETLRVFPSGKQAVQIEAAYYKAYVVSSIVNDAVNTGAVLKYVLTYPETNGLPEVGTIIGTLDEAGDNTEIELPKDAEYYFVEHTGSGEEDSFDVQVENRKLKITLLVTTNSIYGPYGTYKIYIRSGDVFTVVELNVGI